MTGLNLDSFLRLLQADPGTWVVVALVTLGLVLLVWSSWGSRRALRKCLILSLAAHIGLVLYGSTVPAVLWALGPGRRDLSKQGHIREIRVAPLNEPARSNDARTLAPSDAQALAAAKRVQNDALRWDFLSADAERPDPSLKVERPKTADPSLAVPDFSRQFSSPSPVAATMPPVPQVPAATAAPEPRAELNAKGEAIASVPAVPMAPNLAEVSQADVAGPDEPEAVAAGGAGRGEETIPSAGIVMQSDRRLRVDRPDAAVAANALRSGMEGPDPNRGGVSGDNPRRPGAAAAGRPSGRETLAKTAEIPGRGDERPIPLALATPKTPSSSGSKLAALGERTRGQGLTEVPKLYQPRLSPDRSTHAKGKGASAASELAVERALDWLVRHQDDDGCWNAGVAHYEDGAAVKGDTSFTAHCPPGETCFGECAYWEADTALTGLALLTFLGAGYTHSDGRYAEAVEKGLNYLLSQQKPDGDLRGRSQVVGTYCHAMATLALCEAYALTSDERLRASVERAITFLVNSRARDGMAWRYAAGAPSGDTSILGWVVMCLKSAKEVGITTPREASVRSGALKWLDLVATGDSKGLGRYQPWEPVTPTMTAEAWVCRQFLGAGGPGPASTEAAEYLLRNASDHGPTNMYYWYYATLALYQHGGEPWTRWNDSLRDRLVSLQSTIGHQTGSWEPDGSLYGAKGGRIYCTTLAALTLEVYYRYLRLYDEPNLPAGTSAGPRRQSGPPPQSESTSTSP